MCTSGGEKGTLELHIGELHPWWELLRRRLQEEMIDRLEAFPAFPRVTLTVRMGDLEQTFQLSHHMDQTHSSPDEEAVLHTRWDLLDE